MQKIHTNNSKKRRQLRVRSKAKGTSLRPRLTVYRSNKHIYAQIIDDSKAITISSANDKSSKGTKIEKASNVGKTVADAALKKGIEKVVFDRGSYAYHGRIKALAEAAREAGLNF